MNALALFAKLPRAGEVKTRLVPPLSPHGAAALAEAFLRDCSAALVRAADALAAVPYVFYAPGGCGDAVRALVGDRVHLQPQSGGDLGERLTCADRALANAAHEQLCFLGADAPTLPLAYVLAAFAALAEGTDVALGPASDGGYYALALRGVGRNESAHLALFARIGWSGPQVAAQTLERIAAQGLSHVVLPEWYDVDGPAALERLRRELCGGEPALVRGDDAPATRAVLCASDRTRALTLT
ncbi:MAG: TIGR04282 family arsenosugar biosynthesis glycosyltransferase [Vulcanimicrobiaceae bacterium]